uniref:Titin n=1 Tax=Neovison vison TaxID=452646 RepID=A0A8C7AFF9_NEOVI
VYEVSEESTTEEKVLVTHPPKMKTKITTVPEPPKKVVPEDKVYVTIPKKRETPATKEPDTTREVFPEVELPEAVPQIPEHPPTEGIILSYENLKRIFLLQSEKYV